LEKDRNGKVTMKSEYVDSKPPKLLPFINLKERQDQFKVTSHNKITADPMNIFKLLYGIKKKPFQFQLFSVLKISGIGLSFRATKLLARALVENRSVKELSLNYCGLNLQRKVNLSYVKRF